MMLHGRTAIVTGGGSGIGRAAARRFAQQGARLCIADANEAAATATAQALRDAGHDAFALATDVTDPQAVDSAVAVTLSRFGRLDILLHSAGVGIEQAFLDTELAQWRRVLDIDLTGTFLMCQSAARAMRDQRYGRIVTISSTAGILGGTGRAAYGAAKAGVIGLTRVMAVELAPYGITANCLAPGAIETELVARMHSDETRTVYRAGIPMDRYGTPEEVAEAALFLASEAASYVTGHVLGVDGGFLAAGVMHRRQSEQQG
ncbi:SDR family NAD(P)-dependent oxidoreductase [Sphingosinithalassobacter portus]|uniref:SDR family NAD(P)-dependent oxidoreductase n=1 Tax=Stakelama portus TaxID=2676234 RepID=UPI000D6E81CF|nr:SDR family NAD(P)-dependent oxidoreductase [Sphingosinithalassobacter portus]